MFDIVYGKDKTILRVKDTFALLRTGVFDGDERYLEISDNTIRVIKDVRNYSIIIGSPVRTDIQNIVLSALNESRQK